MSKMTDKKCQDCANYDICEKDSSADCDNYEYYKCRECQNRMIKIKRASIEKIKGISTITTKGESRCLRGDKPCSQVRFCQIGGN